MKKIFVWLFVIGVSGFIVGCGQQAPEIKTSTAQPKGLAIVGTVYDSQGSISGQPIADATVRLIGDTTRVATSNSDGSYKFSDVALSEYTIIVTKEGYQDYTSGVSFYGAADNYIETANVPLNNTPLILSINPGNNTNVSPNTTEITIEFNEAMDVNSVYSYFLYNGIKIADVSAAGLSTTTQSWSADHKTLVVNLNSALIEGGSYSLYLVGPTGAYDSIVDAAGNALAYSSYSTYPDFKTPSVSTPLGSGYGIVVAFYASTTATDKPGAVTGLSITDSSGSSDIDYSDVSSAYSDTLILNWNTTPEAIGYKVYGSYNSGPYQQLYVSGYGYNPVSSNSAVLDISSVDSSLADLNRVGGGSYPVDLGIPWPFLGSGINLKVAAVNAAGETLSVSLGARDNVKPRVSSVSLSSSTEIVIYFTEPLSKTSAETIGNYTIAGQSVTNVILSNNYSSPTLSKATLTLAPGAGSGTVTVEANVTDLSGNGMDPDHNSAAW